MRGIAGWTLFFSPWRSLVKSGHSLRVIPIARCRVSRDCLFDRRQVFPAEDNVDRSQCLCQSVASPSAD